jgi:LacI family transcriptional regulator
MAGLKEIALDTGFSIRTVNRALKGDRYVNAETRERVLEAAKRLEYHPNLTARSLKTGKSYEVVAIQGIQTDELQIEKMVAFEEALRRQGYMLTILYGPPLEDPFATRDLITRCAERRPAGIALFRDAHVPAATIQSHFAETNTPTVMIDCGPADGPGVRVGRWQGVYRAIQYLASKGRERIAYAGDAGGERLEGYRRAIEELGRIPIEVIPPKAPTDMLTSFQDLEFEEGRQAAREILKMKPMPDAIQTFSDITALGVLSVLHEKKISIPKQIAVVGFDNRHFTQYLWPRLTTVAQPNREVGRLAAEWLVRKMTGSSVDAESESQICPGELVVRDSA